MPHTVRKEMGRPERSGIILREVEDVDPWGPQMFTLASEHFWRLNRLPLPFGPQLMPALKRGLGARCCIFGAFAGEELVGFSLGCHDQRTGHMLFIGLGEPALRTCTYMNLLFYRPIAQAIARRLERLYFGILAYRVKQRRGCRLEPAHLYYRASHPARQVMLKPWFALHNRMAGYRPTLCSAATT